MGFDGGFMNFASYVKTLKKYAINRKISDETFLNAVLEPYITAGKVNNKLNEDFYLDKSRTSLLLNGSDYTPGALRLALSVSTLYEDTEENFTDFINEQLRRDEIGKLIEDLCALIEDDADIGDKSTLMSKKDTPAIFLADTLIEMIKHRNNGGATKGEITRNGAYCLSVIYEDIFKYGFRKRAREKNIVVIPVDDKFHTHITRKYENASLPEVSEKTLHGQWLMRCEKSGMDLEQLKDRIVENLCLRKIYSDDEGSYPIGTIATIENANTIFYLLVISSFDGNNNARTTKDNITLAIEKLANHYDCYGEGYNLYIPLMGTGKSRANISLQESLDLIMGYYYQNQSMIQGNIHIVVYKEFENLVKAKEKI